MIDKKFTGETPLLSKAEQVKEQLDGLYSRVPKEQRDALMVELSIINVCCSPHLTNIEKKDFILSALPLARAIAVQGVAEENKSILKSSPAQIWPAIVEEFSSVSTYLRMEALVKFHSALNTVQRRVWDTMSPEKRQEMLDAGAEHPYGKGSDI